MENVDSLVISQYVLLKGRKVLLFPQGTRKSSLDLKNVKFGLYNILHDLSVFHRQDIPVVPASIRYEGGLFYKSAVSVSFAPPRYVSPYLGGSFDRPHEAFMSDVAQDIRALAKL